ncbi:SPOR domain-containing protein [Novosphingobium umbonatum]|uniref:SPOR domain-containing protein n=1 Tax=Novosphingobium umbonatum TaxID=1908524 RepID=A0A437N5U2_9SPHN|nr:SPOR domain-containing protein [Novosphingobium umbonatum]RVU05299.1 SPOR domain-containing protein [Novosphingobium umbonatum]
MQHDPKGDGGRKSAGLGAAGLRQLRISLATCVALGLAGTAQAADKHGAKTAPVGHFVKAAAVKQSPVLSAAEQAVAKQPRDAGARAALGRIYLREGRFLSAATALGDAVSLGDTGNRTLLALALAQVGSGQDGAALMTLEQGKGSIPVVDLGLALALAGEPEKGAALLADAVKAGDGSEKLRANLAYAYALAGDWAQARNLISTDLPADRVDARMTEWAAKAKPEASRERVASLLGVAIKSDTGLPARLALAPAPAPVQAKVDSPVMAAAAETAVPTPVLAANSAESSELAPTVPAPVASSANVENFRVITASMTPVSPAPDMAAPAVDPKPVAAKLADKTKAKAKPAKAQTKSPDAQMAQAEPAAKPAPKVLRSGNHMVQLGAFLSEQNAQRARDAAVARDKGLEGRISIAKATVNGRDFWRVTVAGLDAASAAGKCEAIRKAGGACFARANLPAAVGVPTIHTAVLAPKITTPAKAVAKAAVQAKPADKPKQVAAASPAPKENISPRSMALAMAVKARLAH